MYTIQVDPHTHTIASGHAFSTIGENALEAAKRGLTAIAMTDHHSPQFTPLLPDGKPVFGTTLNMSALPRIIHGVRVLAGVELDIVDHAGHLFTHDLPALVSGQPYLEYLLSTREIAIASVHGFPGSGDGTPAQNTAMYVNAIRTPGIHILGHIGRTGLPFDIDEVLLAVRGEGKMIEINDHSFDFDEGRRANCRRIAERCAVLGVRVVVSSDAHSAFYVGEFSKATAMLEEIGFPQALIANETLDKLLSVLDAVKMTRS